MVKSQKEMKRQVDRNRKDAEEYRVGDKVLISTKDFLMELCYSARMWTDFRVRVRTE